MKLYQMVLVSGGETEVLDLLCRNDADALLTCHDQLKGHDAAEAWDGNQLICRWERMVGPDRRS